MSNGEKQPTPPPKPTPKPAPQAPQPGPAEKRDWPVSRPAAPVKPPPPKK